MEPKLVNVLEAFNAVTNQGNTLYINRSGFKFPSGGHIQGIQLVDGDPSELILTSSSDSESYMIGCSMQPFKRSAGKVERVTKLSGSPFVHAGGFQQNDSQLVIGVEDNSGRKSSEVQIWTYPAGGTPTKISTIARSGEYESATAGAVGVTSYAHTANGTGMVLAVGSWSCKTIDFYLSPADSLLDPSSTFCKPATDGSGACLPVSTWVKEKANKDGWVNNDIGDYQSINLLTQQDGQIFMVGFYESGGDDRMDLFSVNMNAEPNKMLTKLAERHMYCHDGATFLKGGGLKIVSTTRFDVWAVKGSSGDSDDGTLITVNHFAST